MLITMFKCKIHRATVTQADLNYAGSLTLDRDLMDAAGMREHEQVDVLNIDNGSRFTTYVIEGPRGSGLVCLNGACARLEVRPERHFPAGLLTRRGSAIVDITRLMEKSLHAFCDSRHFLAAPLGQPGDLVIALSYAQMIPQEADNFHPTTVHVDKHNQITKIESTAPNKLPEALLA